MPHKKERREQESAASAPAASAPTASAPPPSDGSPSSDVQDEKFPSKGRIKTCEKLGDTSANSTAADSGKPASAVSAPGGYNAVYTIGNNRSQAN